MRGEGRGVMGAGRGVSEPAPGWRVTRGPDAPRRRAGREWAIGDTCVADLTAAQLEQLRADPGYTVVPLQLGVRGGRGVRGEK